jgi:phosphoserine phosphatase
MAAAGRTAVLVAEGERAMGVIAVEDQIRADAAAAVAALKALGIRRTVMLTGDSRVVAEGVAARLGLDEVAAELFPDAKVERVRRLQAEGYRVAMLGDGINDAPSLLPTSGSRWAKVAPTSRWRQRISSSWRTSWRSCRRRSSPGAGCSRRSSRTSSGSPSS